MKKTARRTIARARFAWEGGSPRGCQEMKTRIEPTSRMEPKPLKKYPKIFFIRCVSDGGGAFLPYSSLLRRTCSRERPSVREVERRRVSSCTEILCQSRSASSGGREELTQLKSASLTSALEYSRYFSRASYHSLQQSLTSWRVPPSVGSHRCRLTYFISRWLFMGTRCLPTRSDIQLE